MLRSSRHRNHKWYQRRRRRYARFLRRDGLNTRAIVYRLSKISNHCYPPSFQAIVDWTEDIVPCPPSIDPSSRSSIRFLRRYVCVLRRHALSPDAILHRIRRLRLAPAEMNINTIYEWTDSILPRKDEQLFGVLAEYRQVRDLRDRLYRTLTANAKYDLDPASAVGLISSYDKLLRLSLILGGHAELLALGRFGKPGTDAIVKRVIRDFGDILIEIGVVDSQSLMQSQKKIIERMFHNVPQWFDLGETEHEMQVFSH